MKSLPDGQLLPLERAMLRDSVLRRRPLIALEVGTWRGGGSTWQIVSALRDIGHGHLLTCEINPDFYAEAFAFYSQPEYALFCTTNNKPSHDLIHEMLDTVGPPDLIFFDGSEVPEDALEDFKLLDASVKSGTVFLMHDWITPESTKADLLKPYLESLATWRILRVIGPPDSVGLVEAVKL